MKTSRSWFWLAMLTAAVMVTAGCTGGLGRLGEPKPPSGGGPLVQPEPHRWHATVKVGTPFTDGREVLYLNGDHRATILYVRVSGDPTLTAEPALLVGPGRARSRIQRLPWPVPTDQVAQPVEPAEGTTITTQKRDPRGWELLVRITAGAPGHHVRDGLRIGYLVDGKTFEQYFPARIDVCAYTTDAQRDRCRQQR